MKLSNFDYELPESFIAKNPANPRDAAKLLVFDTRSGEVEHRVFRDIVEYLFSSDVLVLNRSKVIKARIQFPIGGRVCEIFLLKKIKNNVYSCLVKPGKKFKKGEIILIKASSKIDSNDVKAEVLETNEDGTRIIKFYCDFNIESIGEAPFPPYIKGSKASLDDYQTVYAEEKGSVASPTAGLHFTNELLRKLKSNGVDIEKVLLHVGLGTFLPVKTENIEDHEMHNEFYETDSDLANKLNNARVEKRRIIAVGTTSVRVLESSFENGKFVPKSGDTNIFIYPGYKWKSVDALITNFHLPKSTLIMLVASFIEHRCAVNGMKIDGTKKVLELYEIAKKNNYRFYSFGDAMMVI